MGARKTATGLTPKQQAAADHFLIHGDQTAAYKHGYNAHNMKLTTLYPKASRLFKHPKVEAYIEAAQKKSIKKTILTREQALEHLSKIALGEIADENETPHGVMKSKSTRTQIAAIERLAKMIGWDKQSELEIGGVTFNLNLTGEKD